jgi:hypothetical protein
VSSPTLSILICHLENRADLLNRLMDRLRPQTSQHNIPILWNTDNGQMPTGTKRNLLLDRAPLYTDYVVFIDDDDLVSDDYVAKIMAALESRPDCVGIEGEYSRDGGDFRLFKHSREFADWYESAGVIYRTPNHLNPMRRELAVSARFPDATLGEDFVFSQRVRPMLKTEVYVKGPIYYHLARSRPT